MSLIQVLDRLFIGGIEDARALAESNPAGITTVVILCSEKVQKLSPDINFLRYPVKETLPIAVGHFDEIINSLWENLRWGTVSIHSLAGRNRAPVFAAAWLHCCGCKNIDAALADIQKLHRITPNPILLQSVKELL